jgi:GGDEF domain-containing protein
LYNRSFYVDELNRLERKGPFPVTIIVADLNGLKIANDQWATPPATHCCGVPVRC